MGPESEGDVSPSEFGFLALGLLLGAASGAALVEVLRSRPPTPREVRLTVTPDSVPRRGGSTLASSLRDDETPEDAIGAPGGPADQRVAGDETLTPLGVRPLVGIPIWPEPGSSLLGVGFAPAPQTASASATALHATAMAPSAIGVLERPLALAGREGVGDDGPPTGAAGVQLSGEAAVDENGPFEQDPGGEDGRGETAAGSGPCVDLRRLADERCAVASRAREQAEAALSALRAAQRAYDDHQSRADGAAAEADPRSVRMAKEAAQHAFREARADASDREGIEAAARDWLTEINRINTAARHASHAHAKEQEAARALVPELERLSVEADAARISAEVAEHACVAARQAVADCEEAAARPVRPRQPSSAPPRVFDRGDEVEPEPAIALVTGEGEPAVLRLLRGDRSTLVALVDALAGQDPSERRRWQSAISGFVEAVVARAIESSSLDFPPDHSFWGPFTREQNRDIVAALSSLGYRFDGLGGWVDERVPSQRDLSLAVGYAGLDPMRIRRWPTEPEMRELFADVAVAADEYLVGAAGGLTLGELVTLLGQRADALTDLWNEWGRLRPLLLAP